MSGHNDKYIVFKRETWEKAERLADNSILTDLNESDAVDDAVVIRRQDVFAPPALAAYANAIQTAITIHVDTGSYVPGVDEEPDQVKRLREIADYFHEQAELAYADSARKVPD